MTVAVPERFFAEFDSEFPSAATVQDITNRGLVFAKASLANVVKYTAWESARRIEAIAIPADLAPGAVGLFNEFGNYMAGIASMQQVSVPNVLLQTGQSFQQMAAAMGAFESVPIVGQILAFALTAAEGAISSYGFKHTKELEAFPMGYDRDRDEDWARVTLKLHAGRDLTSMFLPVNDAHGGVEKFNTQVGQGWTGSNTEIERAIYVPYGNETGNVGALPNTATVPKGWEMNMAWNPRTRPQGVPWSHFMPATSQAVLASWQGVLSNSRACYLVDAVAVERAWTAWQDNMQLWGWGSRYSGNDKIRISMLSRAPVDYAAQQTIASDGFRRLVPFWPGDGMTKSGNTAGSKPHYGPLLGDVGAWAANVQLGRRQRKYLGTLTVAYCSEDDPAFRSDPMLADLLHERRQMLLDHPAVDLVDLDQVVDGDYRSALQLRQGPKDIAQPEGGPGHAGPKGLAGGAGAAAPLPPILVARAGNGAPMLPTGRQRGDGLRNAALLALLGFLVR